MEASNTIILKPLKQMELKKDSENESVMLDRVIQRDSLDKVRPHVGNSNRRPMKRRRGFGI